MTPPDHSRGANGTGESVNTTVRHPADVEGSLACVDCASYWIEHWLGPSCRHCGCPGEVFVSPVIAPRRRHPGQGDDEDFDDHFAPKPRRVITRPPGHLSSSTDVLARLRGIETFLRASVEGQRNPRLHWCACRVGEMLADGELVNAGRAADMLTTVASEIGLTDAEIGKTVASGFSASGVRV